MRISDWSSDVCSSDLLALQHMKAVNDGFALSAVEVAHKVRDGNMNATSGLAVLQSARPVIDRNWKALTSLPGWANQPGSARLADAKEQADVALDKLTEILSQGGDRDTLDFFVTGSLYSFIDQIGRAHV